MVEYRRLTAEDVDAVLEMQRQVFGVSEADLIPGPLLRLVARDEPPMGLHLGAFLSEGQLVGAILAFAALEPGTLYTVMLGVMPEFQNGPYGTKLLLKFREEAMARGLTTMYGVYEVLDTRLARLYAGGVGFVGTKLLGHSVFFRWDFASPHVLGKLNRATLAVPSPDEVRIPILTGTEEERERTLGLIQDYLNGRKYFMVDCVTDRSGEQRLSTYVLRPAF